MQAFFKATAHKNLHVRRIYMFGNTSVWTGRVCAHAVGMSVSDVSKSVSVCGIACCCEPKHRWVYGRHVKNAHDRVRRFIPADLNQFFWQPVTLPSDDAIGRGLYTGATFAATLFLHEHADAAIHTTLLKEISAIIAEPRESAGYILTDAHGVKADELQIVNRGLTFAEEPRLGVTPVDHTEDMHVFSARDGCQKRQLACFHCHPSVIEDKLGAHAPPSFEDGAVLLTALTWSTRHLVIGYTGIYVIEKLNGPGWSIYQRRTQCERCLRARARRLGLTNFDVRLATKALLDWQDTFDFKVGADGDLLDLLRSCAFQSLRELQDYFTVFCVLFRGNLMVDYHAFEHAQFKRLRV